MSNAYEVLLIDDPAVRFGTPDMQYHAWMMGMRAGTEAMLTGDSMSGVEAVRTGWANRAFPSAELEGGVLAMASRIAQIPSDIVQINKRTVHRATEVMGMRTALREGTELSALAQQTETFRAFIEERMSGLREALSKRDAPFADYRTKST